MSLRQRGEEVTLRIAVDGQLLTGSMLKVEDFTATPRTDLIEDDFLGESESDLDIQHHGWDLSWSVQNQDAVAIDLCDLIIEREQNHEAHPDITITAIHAYRERGEQTRIVVYRKCFVKEAETAAGGRKERVVTQYEAKCKRRAVLTG